MKKLFMLIVVGFLLVSFISCTENQRAKSFGGNAKVKLEQGKKLVNVTWKEDNLWILVVDREGNETPKTYQFSEESSFGLLEGSYTIIEQ